MVSFALLSGLTIGVIAMGFVLADTSRREFSTRSRLLWTGTAGAISIGGFLTVRTFDDLLYRLYLDTPPVAPLPRAVAEMFLLVGLATGAAAVLLYGFGSRYGPLKAT